MYHRIKSATEVISNVLKLRLREWLQPFPKQVSLARFSSSIRSNSSSETVIRNILPHELSTGRTFCLLGLAAFGSRQALPSALLVYLCGALSLNVRPPVGRHSLSKRHLLIKFAGVAGDQHFERGQSPRTCSKNRLVAINSKNLVIAINEIPGGSPVVVGKFQETDFVFNRNPTP